MIATSLGPFRYIVMAVLCFTVTPDQSLVHFRSRPLEARLTQTTYRSSHSRRFDGSRPLVRDRRRGDNSNERTPSFRFDLYGNLITGFCAGINSLIQNWPSEARAGLTLQPTRFNQNATESMLEVRTTRPPGRLDRLRAVDNNAQLTTYY